MRRRWTAVGVCLTFALAIGAAQQPSAPPPDSIPSFRGGIDIVELDVSVLGKDRMPIRGLTPSDFTVLEDGKPQPIVAFDAVDLPDVNHDGASWLRDVAPDVATNHRDAHRVVLILVDDCNVPFEDTKLAKQISHTVVDELGPADLAAVIYTFARDQGQEFTADRALLRASMVIGSLLADGIGDAILVRGEPGAGQSLRLSFNILQAAGCRSFKTDYVACPSCGRTLFNLQTVTARIKQRTEHLKGVKIAIMGCIVNGPGEMADADFGYVGGAPGKINLYIGKTPIKFNIPEAEAVDRLVDLVREHGKWIEPSA